MIWFDHDEDRTVDRVEVIRAPFRRLSHAIGTLAFVVGITLAPIVFNNLAPPAPEQIYRGIPAIYGNFYTIGEELAKPGKIDVLIVGSSDAWTSLDPRIVHGALESRFGETMRVLNLGTNWAGLDRDVQIVHDVLRAHEVELVLVPESDPIQVAPHELAKHWWRGDVSTRGLLVSQRAQLYLMSVIGFPRQLWSRFKSPESLPLLESYRAYVDSQLQLYGFNSARTGWLSNYSTDTSDRREFVPLDAPSPAVTDEALFFQGEPNEYFALRFDYSPMQTHFVTSIRDMVRAQGGVFATFSIPTHFQNEILEQAWVRPHVSIDRDWPTIGISMSNLFPNYSFDQMLDYYGNESHLNTNGAIAYTRALLPAIETLYAEAMDD